MTQAVIYGLRDPRDGHIWYVGCSYQPERRLAGHLTAAKSGSTGRKCEWIRELLREGLKPSVDILQRLPQGASKGELTAAEESWLVRLRQAGEPLTNANAGGGGIRDTEPLMGVLRTLKIPASMKRRIEARQGHARVATGIRVTEADTVRALLQEALDAWEASEKDQ